jgi:N4-gp56 family major capsid protein
MADQVTNMTSLTNLVPTYYSKRLLERLQPNCRAYQLAEKRSIPANSGKSILWNRFEQLSDGGSLTEGTPPDAVMMSTIAVSCTLVQYGKLVRLTDLVETTAITNTVNAAVDILADNAAITIDKYILNTIGFFMSAVGAINGFSAHFHSYQFPIEHSKTSGSLDKEKGFFLESAMNISDYASTPMCVSAIRRCVTKLRQRSVSPFEDGFYHAIIHPQMSDAIRGDSSWASWNQYTRPEKMDRGLIGEVEGVKFYDDPNMSSFNISGAAILGMANVSNMLGSGGGRYFGTLIFGRGAYAVTELEGMGTGDNATKVYITPRDKPDKSDPLQQYSYVGYKSTFAAKILNPSCGVVLVTNGTAYV